MTVASIASRRMALGLPTSPFSSGVIVAALSPRPDSRIADGRLLHHLVPRSGAGSPGRGRSAAGRSAARSRPGAGRAAIPPAAPARSGPLPARRRSAWARSAPPLAGAVAPADRRLRLGPQSTGSSSNGGGSWRVPAAFEQGVDSATADEPAATRRASGEKHWRRAPGPGRRRPRPGTGADCDPGSSGHGDRREHSRRGDARWRPPPARPDRQRRPWQTAAGSPAGATPLATASSSATPRPVIVPDCGPGMAGLAPGAPPPQVRTAVPVPGPPGAPAPTAPPPPARPTAPPTAASQPTGSPQPAGSPASSE